MNADLSTSTLQDDDGNQPIVRSRLLPQISFKALFLLTLFAAVISGIGRAAGAGNVIAIAVISMMAFLYIVFMVLMAIFLVAWLVAVVWYTRDMEAENSRNDPDALPPQIIPPRDRRE